MAAESSVGHRGPPKSYRLDEVSVRIQTQGSRGVPVRRITLNGTGTGTLERDQQKSSFAYSSKDLLVGVNALYAMRFFTMPDDYFVTFSVFLKDDGSIGTQAMNLSDTGSTQVCFVAGSFEKCVAYGAHGPQELADFVQRVVAQTGQTAGPAK